MTIFSTEHSQQLVALFLLSILAISDSVSTNSRLQRILNRNPTPYPAAGFRPRIPFNLPVPRESKVFVPSSTSSPTLIASSSTNQPHIDINIETLEQTTNAIRDLFEPTARKPANTYGTPITATATEVDLSSETEVINAPAEHLEPPSPDAAKNFNTNYFKQENPLVLDVPIVDDGVDSLNTQPQQPFNTLNRRVQTPPSGTYGVPNFTNNEPNITMDTETTTELEFNEPDNELPELLVSNNAALKRLDTLKLDQLIILPPDMTYLRQIYLRNKQNS